MSNVLILGAGGQVARLVRERFLNETDARLTLYMRNAHRLRISDPNRERVIEGDVNDTARLQEAMAGQEVVYVNLGGSDIALKTRNIIEAMRACKVRRGIFINILGIYDEVPGRFGEWNKRMVGSGMEEWREAAGLIEQSDLDYTILRGTWFTNKDEVDYELSDKGEPLRGTEISRKSIAAVVVQLAETKEYGLRRSWGISKPNTAGDKPSFY